MMQSKLRNIFSLHNKYQKQIILLEIVPLLIASIGVTIVVFLMDAQVNELLNSQSYGMIAACIGQWFYLSVCFIFALSIFFFIVAFKFSQNLVNPFPRILREVDEVLAKGVKKNITARPEDELANEVIRRLNALINRMN